MNADRLRISRLHRLASLVATVVAFGCESRHRPPRSLADPPHPTAATHPAAPRAPAKIAEFQGEYRFLSNFWLSEVWFEGARYPSVEHAYQAAKSLDPAERRRVAALATPADAKRAGRALSLRPDWERAKFAVMEACVRDKFTRHAGLRAKLLATGDAVLEEGNTWGDRVWGVCNGAGENRLGKILMQVRAELRAAGR
ncbi:MAG: NADAR family protein [Phycisphaerae bacterium]